MLDKSIIRKKCRLAIENIRKEGTTDVELFNSPFELEYLKIENVRKELIDFVTNAIISKNFEELKVGKIGHVMVPKKDLCDFRKCAWIDIRDEIVYLTLVLLIADSVEKERIKKSSKKVFSYRVSSLKTGCLFDAIYHFTSFRDEINKKTHAKKNKVLVECDVSNFYDRINIHRIESALLSIEGIDSDIVNLINELLLYWANRDSYGLPVGSNASRILAEAALINADSFLLSHKVDFCRFVDDYRIFAKDADTAHKHLALLTDCLSREGLFVNTQKTKMQDISKKTENKTNAAEVIPSKIESPSFKDDLPKIIRGYNGLIPTKFRELSQREQKELKTQSIEKHFENIEKSIILEEEDIKKAIKLISAQEKFSYIHNAASMLRKFPQFIPYFVDFISRKKDSISQEDMKKVKELFSKWYCEEEVPEYILVYLVRLFKIDAVDKSVLLNAFRNLKRTSGDYIGRVLLESFNGVLTRTEVMEVREYYVRADIWEKRQILRLIQSVLPLGEKRAFFKDVKIHNSDPFVHCIIDTKEDYIKITTNIK